MKHGYSKFQKKCSYCHTMPELFCQEIKTSVLQQQLKCRCMLFPTTVGMTGNTVLSESICEPCV